MLLPSFALMKHSFSVYLYAWKSIHRATDRGQSVIMTATDALAPFPFDRHRIPVLAGIQAAPVHAELR